MNPPESRFLEPEEKIVGSDGLSVLDFWRWAYSDVLSNRNRSIFAEFVVGVALGAASQPRVEWDSVDLHYAGSKIEVKSSADIQSWKQKRLSKNVFSIRKAVPWDSNIGEYIGEPTRSADAYVFCHYPERDPEKCNVLNVPGWDFYVMSVDSVNERFGARKTVGLSAVQRAATRCKFDHLRATVDRVLQAKATRIQSSATANQQWLNF